MRYSFLFLLLIFLRAATPADAQVSSTSFEGIIRPWIEKHCLDCHSTEKQKGELDLEQFSSLAGVKRQPKIWQKVLEQLKDGEMPPEKKPQPSPDQKELVMAWVRETLDAIALEHAGDPGRVVLRRLSNAEYSYTVRDLTGVESLDPAREFPADGAAGEGFTNTGQALPMSPSLIAKYLNAGKEIADHAVLLPDGIRFSSKTTRHDWTDELLGRIRQFYGKFTDSTGKVDLQPYLSASLELRDTDRSVEAVARERRLNARYLMTILKLFQGRDPSPVLDGLRARWRAAEPSDTETLAAAISSWQETLWTFGSVGHIGVAGAEAWMNPVTPLTGQQDWKIKIPKPESGSEIVIYLVTGDAGDGTADDIAVWRKPQFVFPGRPPVLLRDVRRYVQELNEWRRQYFLSTTRFLAAAADAQSSQGDFDTAAVARQHDVNEGDLAAWLDYLGIGSGGAFQLDLFTKTIRGAGNYEFVNGWGAESTPFLLANSSDQLVSIPGTIKPHGVMVHPTPELKVGAGWKSPVKTVLHIEGTVAHAHPACGNGVAWSLELRRGQSRQRLANGVSQAGEEVVVGPIENVSVQRGDLVSLLVDPRGRNHSCDSTRIELNLRSTGASPLEWSLADDVSGNVLAGNPHSDSMGNEAVWHFYTEPATDNPIGPSVPTGSLLAKWLSASNPPEKRTIAEALQVLLTSAPPASGENRELYQQLVSLNGPLLARTTVRFGAEKSSPVRPAESSWGLDPAMFGHRPNGDPINADSLCVQAPSVLEIRLPADLFADSELVTTTVLAESTGAEGSVQLQVLTGKPNDPSELIPSTFTASKGGYWSSHDNSYSFSAPVVVKNEGRGRARFQSAFDEFRQVFPAAFCYTRIVPVDEVVTLTLYYREDEHLSRLMLDEAERRELDQVWDELRYVGQDALKLVDVLEQIYQFATQDADPTVFEPLREPFQQRADAFRHRLLETEPRHVEAVLEFADRAFRRPLSRREKTELRHLYDQLRQQELPHDPAIRLTLARVLLSPAFLYRPETPGPGADPAPVKDWELASRLSYFLWSSTPDAELRATAESGGLRDPEQLIEQTRRMLADPRVRRMSTEFACQWLQIYDFDQLDEKSERHFPTFIGLRDVMYQESILFFTDLFQHNGSVLGILDADHTFLNEALARHYGIPGVTGPEWRRVDGMKEHFRGGILGQATTLAKQSGASRTSPILRGNWISETLLGEKLPRPPKDVPPLPKEEDTEFLSMRQVTERHTSDPSCSKCHQRIDPLGYTLENFDAIGRWRDRDPGNNPIDTKTTLMDGTQLRGVEGLRNYLLTERRETFLRQFCKKLLGYSLGRAVQLSDEPLLREIQTQLAANDFRIGVAIESIVLSRQFREIRGVTLAIDE